MKRQHPLPNIMRNSKRTNNWDATKAALLPSSTSATRHSSSDSLLTRQDPSAILNEFSFGSQQAHRVSSVTLCIDKAIHEDPRVLSNLLQAEVCFLANSRHFNSIQPEVQPIHREVTVEWMLDVCLAENLGLDVFPSAVSLLDRFLSVKQINLRNLQTVGFVCVLMATKLKNQKPIAAARISYLTENFANIEDILKFELIILYELNWHVLIPTAFDFLEHLWAGQPRLLALREGFTKRLQKLQCSIILAALRPSLQASLCLLSTATNETRELVSVVKEKIVNKFGIDLNLIHKNIRTLAQICRDDFREMFVDFTVNSAKVAARTPTRRISHNDSGYSSAFSTPEEGAGAKEGGFRTPKRPRVI